MARIWKLVAGVGPTPATVLITGESGTGKEVIARLLHQLSPRSQQPFVAVNCGAVVSSLAESELFGHEKGAFTGADHHRLGVFEAAHGGTLLLDEISELPPPLQAKLLRVLQERQVTRVGSNRPRDVDVRFIATTNRDLGAMVASGDFRQDLFYRVNVFPLHVTPLRARMVDVPRLAEAMLGDLGRRFRCRPTLSKDALTALASYRWPGNVRELRNLLERCLVLTPTGEIDAHVVRRALGLSAAQRVPALPSLVRCPSEIADLTANDVTLADVERDLILARLAHLHGNRTHTARSLGISVRTLRNKLRNYRDRGLPIPSPSSNSPNS